MYRCHDIFNDITIDSAECSCKDWFETAKFLTFCFRVFTSANSEIPLYAKRYRVCVKDF